MEENTVSKDYILIRYPKDSIKDFRFIYGNTKWGIINESYHEDEIADNVACHDIGDISFKRMNELNQIPNELPDKDQFTYEKLSGLSMGIFLKVYNYKRRIYSCERFFNKKPLENNLEVKR